MTDNHRELSHFTRQLQALSWVSGLDHTLSCSIGLSHLRVAKLFSSAQSL
jgi:hypothetical protein